MTMTNYLVRIAPEDHNTFKAIVKHYPADSHDKWLYLQTKEIAEWEGSGNAVELVDISPNEFTSYCDRTGANRDIGTLRSLAMIKAQGKL